MATQELTVSDVKKALGKIKEPAKQYEYLNEIVDKSTNDKFKKKVEKLKNMPMVKGAPLATYSAELDAFGQTLEPIYYWIIDTMKAMGYSVEKTDDVYSASAGGAWYGEMGMRRTALEKRAAELMGAINSIVRSIINLLWDLREFEIRLAMYEKTRDKKISQLEKDAAERQLKAIWLTDVDMKTGAGSINALAQQANFATIRQLFMITNSVKDVDKADTTTMVKHVLDQKVAAYVEWKTHSEEELKKRERIEKAYTKSQVQSLRMYTNWVRPYLLATNKLLPKENMEGAEDLVTSFNVIKFFLEVFGKKEAEGDSELPDKYKQFSCIEVKFNYRVAPGAERAPYYQGKINVEFNCYKLTKRHLDDFDEVKEKEVLSLVDGMTDEMLDAMMVDLRHFEVEEGDEADDETSGIKPLPFIPVFIEGMKPIWEGFKGTVEPFKAAAQGAKHIFFKKPEFDKWELARQEKKATDSAKDDCAKLYKNYKKSRGMLG